MNELEKHKVNRKLDTKEKIVIKALTEKIASLEFEIKKLKSSLKLGYLDRLDRIISDIKHNCKPKQESK